MRLRTIILMRLLGERELKALEDELRNKLYDVVTSVTKLFAGLLICSSPVLMFQDEVNAMFRHYAESGYKMGTEHAALALRQEGYITHADIDAIKQIAADHSARFWARINRGVIEKEQQMRNLQFTGEAPDSHLTKEWIVDPVASSDVFTAYNQAIRTKATRLV